MRLIHDAKHIFEAINLIISTMKILGIFALVFALIGAIVGIYCQLEIVPTADGFGDVFELGEFEKIIYHEYKNQKFVLGSIALFSGILAVVIGIYPAIKKVKLAWVAAGIGLIAFFLGAMQSTHLFS